MNTTITWDNFKDLVGQKGFYHDRDKQLIALPPYWLDRPVRAVLRYTFGVNGMCPNFKDWFMKKGLHPKASMSLGRRLFRYGVTNDRVLDRAILGSVYPKPEKLWHIGELSGVKPIHLEDFLQIYNATDLLRELELLGRNFTFLVIDRFGTTSRVEIRTGDDIVRAFNVNPNNHRRDHSLLIPSRSIILTPGLNIP